MNPLDETLRASAAAVSGRSGARQGGKDQSAGEPGAFENAVADAGRQKQQGQGAAASTKQDAGDSSDPQADPAIANRGAGIPVASNAIETSARLAAASAQHVASEDRPSSDAVSGRQKAMTCLQQLAGGATPKSDEAAGEPDEHALTATSKWNSRPS
ncbi:MAG TPA: flagellar hook-length control protein FliK, partial [Sinorhizobium sp.]|nr:flagellar hook-length control protein FliK [Sinorhizobium sp.]